MKIPRKSKTNRKTKRQSLRNRRKTRNKKRNKKTLTKRKSRRIQKRKNKINKKIGGNIEITNFVLRILKNVPELNCRGKEKFKPLVAEYVKNIIQLERQKVFEISSQIKLFNLSENKILPFSEKYKFKNRVKDFNFWDLNFPRGEQKISQFIAIEYEPKGIASNNTSQSGEIEVSDLKLFFDFIINFSFIYNIKKFFTFDETPNNIKNISRYFSVLRKSNDRGQSIKDQDIENLFNTIIDDTINKNALNEFIDKQKYIIEYIENLNGVYKQLNLDKLISQDNLENIANLKIIDKILILIIDKIKNFQNQGILEQYINNLKQQEYEKAKETFKKIKKEIEFNVLNQADIIDLNILINSNETDKKLNLQFLSEKSTAAGSKEDIKKTFLIQFDTDLYNEELPSEFISEATGAYNEFKRNEIENKIREIIVIGIFHNFQIKNE